LKINIQAGKNNEMEPKELRESRLAYQDFTLKVFRKHIYQQVRTDRETPHWLAKKAAKKNGEKIEEAELVLD
jgi:hypothetical protein